MGNLKATALSKLHPKMQLSMQKYLFSEIKKNQRVELLALSLCEGLKPPPISAVEFKALGRVFIADELPELGRKCQGPARVLPRLPGGFPAGSRPVWPYDYYEGLSAVLSNSGQTELGAPGVALSQPAPRRRPSGWPHTGRPCHRLVLLALGHCVKEVLLHDSFQVR